MSAAGETVERAIVFEDAFGYRKVSALRCVDIWLSALDESLLQVDLGLKEAGPVLFVILRLREDRFTDGTQAAIVNAGEHAGGRVVALSELEYQERGAFLSRFAECGVQRLGLLPDEVLKVLEDLFARVPERRAEVRHPVDAPAVVKVGGEKLEGELENLSAGGALFRTLTPPPVVREKVAAQKVQLEVKLPSGEVKATAKVVNVSEKGVSLQFEPADKGAVAQQLAALPAPKLESQLTVDALVAAPASESKPASGVERVGKYEVLSMLGSGGTSVVHFARVAEGKNAGQHVALKRLHARRAQDPAAVRAFEAEARTLSLLKHPNIVRTVDAGVFDGHHCLVMELVEGHDLSQILRRARTRKKQLPVDLACYVVKVLLDALTAVHAAKDETGAAVELVHGDVSPHNLFVSKAGVIKLGDFGLTRRSGEVTEALKEGRPTYLSPEALDGVVAPAVDLWAVAVTLYELLTLEAPFKGETIEQLTVAIRAGREVPLREKREECSGPLEALLRSALEKDRALRPQSARDFASSLAVHFHPVRAARALPDVVKGLFEK